VLKEYFIREPEEVDFEASEKLCNWVNSLFEYASAERNKKIDTKKWDDVWKFIRGEQWSSTNFPSYKLPIKFNSIRRTLTILSSVLTGGRPILKIVPQPLLTPRNPEEQKNLQEYMKSCEVLQHALWSVWKAEAIQRKLTIALLWAIVGNGGWLKIAYGKRNPFVEGWADVIVEAIHPKKIYVDPEAVDVNLSDANFVIYREALDLSQISARYPEMAKYVKPDTDASWIDPTEKEDWQTPLRLAPAGSWVTNGKDIKRARAFVTELWINDTSLELTWREEATGVDVNTGMPIIEKIPEWIPKYPYGRLITCTKDVVLRDIPNPYGKAFGWTDRYPFVYLQGSEDVSPLYAPGPLSDITETQKAVNKSLQLILENMIKFCSLYVIADENAMDDEQWDMLAIFPGAKYRVRPNSNFRIEAPPPLSQPYLDLPDYFIRKMEQEVGLQDPPLPPGQAVAAKTIELLQQKGNFLIGNLAKFVDDALERLGRRMVGMIVEFYEEGRPIPFFDGEVMREIIAWEDLPSSMQYRVEATSAWTEIMAAMMQNAKIEAELEKKKK